MPTTRRGDALLFDYRVKHRGLGNKSDEARPLLYFTFASAGWRDTHNFSQARYHKMPELITVQTREERLRQRHAGQFNK